MKHLLKSHTQDLLQLEKRLPHPRREIQNISQRLDDISLRLQQGSRAALALKRSRVLTLSARVNRHSPLQQLKLYRDKSRHLTEQLRSGLSHHLSKIKARLHHLGHSLHTVSPLATLERGYAIVSDKQNRVIRTANQVSENAEITTQLAKGKLKSTVNKII